MQSLFSSSLRVWERFNQAWESCITIRQSGDRITHEKWYNFQKELISTLKNHMEAIVILLMQSGMTFSMN